MYFSSPPPSPTPHTTPFILLREFRKWQQTVGFSTVVSRAADESFLSLKELVDKSRSSDQSDYEKEIGLLKFIVKTQQRLLRLNVLAKWFR
ncbi:hypothetical protein Nepgr_015044 [Nepenthes gracilis]|uniref:Mediator of RNA polymerase II transcription subunit 14 n=1 Tax=Nepenthes gracilis TaxID=150966 RepID=A0AAD3SKL4_NEPGR|nr:hypothetical protein Nepgr_015044 [Nepenthes gracilis]